MLGDKTEHFQGKGTDLGALQAHIEKYLTDDGFKVQSSAASDKGTVIQAKKSGFLRDVVDADRAFTITITGDPRTSRCASALASGSSTSASPPSRRCSSLKSSSWSTSPTRPGASRSRTRSSPI